MAIEYRPFLSVVDAANKLADELAADLQQAITDRGQASLAVSGGRTPRHVFEQLRSAGLDWKRVTITLTDERWVPASHPDSNEKLVRDFLLQGAAASATFIPLYGGEASPDAGQSACETRLKNIELPFDAVYLGMGSDGHFASLFPGDPAGEVHSSCCIAVPAKNGRQSRMSLTAPTVLRARKVYLLYSGLEKQATYAEAIKPGSFMELPLRRVLLQDQAPVIVLAAQ